jgi:hypothetical protein
MTVRIVYEPLTFTAFSTEMGTHDRVWVYPMRYEVQVPIVYLDDYAASASFFTFNNACENEGQNNS